MRCWRKTGLLVAATMLGGCCSHRDPTTGLVVHDDCGAAHAIPEVIGGLLYLALESGVGLCGG